MLSYAQAGHLPTCLISSLLFTSPTNVSDIGLNRGKYPSYYKVWNAVRIIQMGPWANGVAFHRLTCLICSPLYTSPTNVSAIGLNSKYPSHYQVWNAVRIIHAYDIANAVVCTGRPPTNVSDMLPTIHLTYQRV